MDFMNYSGPLDPVAYLNSLLCPKDYRERQAARSDDDLEAFKIGDPIQFSDYRKLLYTTPLLAAVDPFTQWDFLRPAIPWPHTFDGHLGIKDESLIKRISSEIQSWIAPQTTPDEFWYLLGKVYPGIEINLWDLTTLCLVGHYFQDINPRLIPNVTNSAWMKQEILLRRLGDNGETTIKLLLALDKRDKHWSCLVPHGWELVFPSGRTVGYDSSELIHDIRGRIWAAPYPSDVRILFRFVFSGPEGFRNCYYDNQVIESATEDYWLHDWNTIWAKDDIPHENLESSDTGFGSNTDFGYNTDFASNDSFSYNTDLSSDTKLGHDDSFDSERTLVADDSFGSDTTFCDAYIDSRIGSHTGFVLGKDFRATDFSGFGTGISYDTASGGASRSDNDSGPNTDLNHITSPASNIGLATGPSSKIQLLGTENGWYTKISHGNFTNGESVINLGHSNGYICQVSVEGLAGHDKDGDKRPDIRQAMRQHGVDGACEFNENFPVQSKESFREERTKILEDDKNSGNTQGSTNDPRYSGSASPLDEAERTLYYGYGPDNYRHNCIGKGNNKGIGESDPSLFDVRKNDLGETAWNIVEETGGGGPEDSRLSPIDEGGYDEIEDEQTFVDENTDYNFGGQGSTSVDIRAVGYDRNDYIFQSDDDDFPGSFYQTFIKKPVRRSTEKKNRDPRKKSSENCVQRTTDDSDDSDTLESRSIAVKRCYAVIPSSDIQIDITDTCCNSQKRSSLAKPQGTQRQTRKRKICEETEGLLQTKRQRNTSSAESGRKRKLEELEEFEEATNPQKQSRSSQDETSVATTGDIVVHGITLSSEKRVPNSFLLYRSWFSQTSRAGNTKVKNTEISRTAGEGWRKLSPMEKQAWIERSSGLRKIHKGLYPNYQYNPRKSKDIKRRRKHTEEDLPLNKRVKLVVTDSSTKRKLYQDSEDEDIFPVAKRCKTVQEQKELPSKKRQRNYRSEKMDREDFGMMLDGKRGPEIKVFQYKPGKLCWRPGKLAKYTKSGHSTPLPQTYRKKALRNPTSLQKSPPPPPTPLPPAPVQEDSENADTVAITLDQGLEYGHKEEDDISQAFYTHWDTMDDLTLDQLINLGNITAEI
ncbi:hypothetical protein TWF281_002603 [Arthrobotrys megalospora]